MVRHVGDVGPQLGVIAELEIGPTEGSTDWSDRGDNIEANVRADVDLDRKPDL